MYFKYLFLILIIFVQSCALNGRVTAERAPTIVFNVDEPNRIHFEGRGAGAGVMLSSAMGPMGIAIGVAIDEGIAKDIRASASREGIDVSQIIKSGITELLLADSERLTGLVGDQSTLANRRLELTLHRYGFKVAKGSDDLVVPFYSLSVVGDGVSDCQIQSPGYAGFGVGQVVSLSAVKQDGYAVRQAMLASLEVLKGKQHKEPSWACRRISVK